jgi:hypothetical protein
MHDREIAFGIELPEKSAIGAEVLAKETSSALQKDRVVARGTKRVAETEKKRVPPIPGANCFLRALDIADANRSLADELVFSHRFGVVSRHSGRRPAVAGSPHPGY